MTKSKREVFTEEEIQLANVAKALSHPARIKILKILAEKNVCICGELVDNLPLAQATVSQHLKELKKIGLIQGEIEGPKTCYCLSCDFVLKAYESLKGLFDNINQGRCLPCITNPKLKK